MLNVENVATPLTAFTLVVPDSVPPLGFVPIATVIRPVYPVTVFPDASRAVTRTDGIVWPAWVVCGCVVKARFVAGGGGVFEMLHEVLVTPDAPAALADRAEEVPVGLMLNVGNVAKPITAFTSV